MSRVTFQRRHYESIALAMQLACPEKHWDANKRAQFDVVVSRMADLFETDNAKFNRERFTRACESGANVKAKI